MSLKDINPDRDLEDSPCIDLCQSDTDPDLGEYCTGCYRIIDEISSWPNLSAEQRKEVLAKIPERLELLGLD